MPKRVKNKTNTVIVKFYEDVADKEVHSLLTWLGVNGSKVSTLVNRWAVDVLYWKELETTDKLRKSELVEAIQSEPSKITRREEVEDTDGKD
jgi:hypothetical protein